MDSKALNPGNSTLQDGKYIITGVLGQGGFGITYQAEQVSLGRKVAIKEFFMKEYCERDGSTSHVSVPSSGSRELVERFRQKFLREARMIASLNHTNIVKIFDVFEENGTAYYVMEHLSGGSLSDKVRDNGPLSEEQCIDYICQVSSALDYLHRRNTLHFDVKPSNILFDEDGRAVLIDFGISKHYDTGGHQTSSTPVGLSKGFAPLEQYRQDDVSTFTPATDIYSLGATLYFLATGTTPPDASIVYDEGVERPTGISNRVWTAIERAMQPRRKDRPQSIGHFLSLLDGKSGTAGQTAVDPDDETTRMDAAAFQSAPESKRTPAGASATGSRPRQETKPKQEPKSSHKTNPSNASRIDSVADRNNVPSKGFPKWLYGVAAALVLGLIVFLVIPKSKHVGDTPAPDKPEQEQTVTPAPNPQPAPEPEPRIVSLTSISLSKTSLTLEEGATSTLTVKYTPADATDKSTTWKSTDTKVATVSSSGKVTAVKAGSAAIIATAGGRESYCNVTVTAKSQPVQQQSASSTSSGPATGTSNGHEWIDLGLSVKWATCNIGASSPSAYGDYYAWGETSSKSDYSWSTYKYCNGSYTTMTKYCSDSEYGNNGYTDSRTKLELSDDVARQKWGGSWRMPTYDEFRELIDNCTWTWTTMNGVNGYKVTSKKSGYSSRSIFLPAAGYRDDTSLGLAGEYGYYWSSSLYTGFPYGARYLYFYSGFHGTYYYYRDYGRSVRPVCP